MWVSSFPNTIYWREYPFFSIVFWHPCRLYGFISRLYSLLHWFAFSDFMPSPYCFDYYAAAAAKSLQSCPTLCDPIDGKLPGSSIPGILQARRLEWVAISFSNAWKWKVKVKSLSCVHLFMTPWTAAYQAPPSMGVSRQEYWSELPLPSPFDYYSFVLYFETRKWDAFIFALTQYCFDYLRSFVIPYEF